MRERWRVARNDLDAKLNWLLRNPHKPKLFAGDFGMWRRDFERVNGFDQRFRDWGGEDDDLRTRLLRPESGSGPSATSHARSTSGIRPTRPCRGDGRRVATPLSCSAASG